MIKRFFLFLFALAVLAAPAKSELNEIKLYKNDAYVAKIRTYKFGNGLYFDSSEIVKKIGGKTYWYSVSGKLMIQVKLHKIYIYRKTDSVKYDDDISETVPNVMIVRAGRTFLSKDLFVSSSFSKTMGFRIEYDEAGKTLKIFEKINISSIRHFSYSDKTRVVVYLYSPLEFKTSQMEKKTFSISIMDGSYAAQDEKTEVNDGIVDEMNFTQEEKSAKISVSLGENFGEAEVFTLKDPDRIVVDFKIGDERVQNKIGGGDASMLPVIAPDVSGSSVTASTVPAVLPDKANLNSDGKKKIVVDPGHGGKDPGGRKLFGMKEKELNLSVAKELVGLIKKDDKFDVLITRNTDEFIPLSERSEAANKNGADLFVSIHANASKNRKESGFEIYFLSEKATDPWSAEVADYENSVVSFENDNSNYDPAALVLHSLAKNEYINEGSKLAAYISREMESGTPFKNRGIKQAAFYVLRGTYSPGVLVEMGFMTNSRDQKKLNDSGIRKKVAKAIYNGILKYAKSKNW